MILRRFIEKYLLHQNHIWYAPILILAMGLMFVRLLVYAKLLIVSAFAIYSAGVLISGGFLMLGCMGFQSLLQRELPIMIMQRRESAGVIMLMQCMLVALICAAVIGGIVGVSDINLAGLSPVIVLFSLVHGLTMQIFLLASIESRSRAQPMRFALQNLYRAILMLFAGTVVAAVSGNAVAVLAIEATSSLVVSVVLLRNQFNAVSTNIFVIMAVAWRQLLSPVWRPALTLLAVSFISFMVTNSDRWIAAKLLVPTSFAQYAFACTVLTIAQSVQIVINASLFPMLARQFAKNGNNIAFRGCVKFSLVMLILGGLILWPSYLILDYSVSRWFISFLESRELIFVFLVVSVLRLSNFWSSYLVVIGREVELLVLNILSLVIGFLVWQFYSRVFSDMLEIGEIALLCLFLEITVYILAALTAWYFAEHKGKLAI